MKPVKPAQPTAPTKKVKPTPHPTPRATLGAAGERLAASWLEDHGYRILARNWRCHYGELDLIAEREGALIAVEVKTRRGATMGAPEEAVTPTKQRHLIATRIRAAVHQWTGIWVSVGVAPTKTLAKAANDAAKHQATGALALSAEAEIDALLKALAVEDVWGTGARRGTTLRAHGIATAYAFKQTSHTWVKRHLYTPVARTQLELWGVACLPLESAHATKQQIMSSRSFGQPVEDLSDLSKGGAGAVRPTLAPCARRTAHPATRHSGANWGKPSEENSCVG